MKKLSKNRKEKISNIDFSKNYSLVEAIKILKDNSYVKFDESLDVAIKLNINPSKTDQNIRGVVSLPKGTGKKIRVAAMAKGDKAKEATDSGADIVGDENLAQEISNGKINFDLLLKIV